jgi:hypothetical protein
LTSLMPRPTPLFLLLTVPAGCASLVGADFGRPAADAGSSDAGSSDAESSDAESPAEDAAPPAHDAAGADGCACDAASARADANVVPKRVFVTRDTVVGDFGGLGNADAFCGAAATKLGGTWRAWLSDGKTNAIDRIADVGPWLLMGTTTTVFASKASLAGAAAVPIDRDQSGNRLPAPGYVWTATGAGGTFSGLDCYDWTSKDPSAFGNVGNGGGASDWSWSTGVGCSGHYPLYCFEQ